MMYWNGHMTTAGWIIAVLWTVIIFLLIAGGIYWLVGALSGRSGPAQPPQASAETSAREILDRRLAKGEVTLEQYRELREAIDGGSTSAGGDAPVPRPAAGAPG